VVGDETDIGGREGAAGGRRVEGQSVRVTAEVVLEDDEYDWFALALGGGKRLAGKLVSWDAAP